MRKKSVHPRDKREEDSTLLFLSPSFRETMGIFSVKSIHNTIK